MLQKFIRTESIMARKMKVLLSVLVIFAGLAMPAAAQQTATVMGNWNVAWTGARDVYTGLLEVRQKTADNLYEGIITLHPSKGGTVTEKVAVSVVGSDVRIECSDPLPVDVPGTSSWNPDRFYVSWTADRMQGYSLDAIGQRGSQITFTRQ